MEFARSAWAVSSSSFLRSMTPRPPALRWLRDHGLRRLQRKIRTCLRRRSGSGSAVAVER
eukprot:11807816-Alexandrium_andersonii.AAC.1